MTQSDTDGLKIQYPKFPFMKFPLDILLAIYSFHNSSSLCHGYLGQTPTFHSENAGLDGEVSGESAGSDGLLKKCLRRLEVLKPGNPGISMV